jgi:DNA polymerase elongation subunit (family B)
MNFTYTKSLRDPESYTTKNTAHVYLAHKYSESGKNARLVAGDKITYVFIKELNKAEHVKDKILTIDMMNDRGFHIDFAKYKEDVYAMLTQVLEGIVENDFLFKLKKLLIMQ